MTDILILLWLGDIANGVAGLLIGICMLGGVVGGLVVFIGMLEGFIDEKHIPRIIKLTCALAFTALLSALIPSKQWFYIAAGGTTAVRALDTEIGQKVARLVEQKLDEALAGAKK